MDKKSNNKKKYTPKNFQKMDKTKMLSGAVLVLFLTSSVLGYKLYNVSSSNEVEVTECSVDCLDKQVEDKTSINEKSQRNNSFIEQKERMHKKVAPHREFHRNAFEELYDEMERNFDDMAGSFERFADRFEDEFVEPFEKVQERNRFLRRNFSMKDDDDSITYVVRLNEINKDMVDLSIKNGVLVINVEKKINNVKKDENSYSRRASFNSYHKEFLLPQNVDTKSASAVIENDELRISFKKKVKDKKIEIK